MPVDLNLGKNYKRLPDVLERYDRDYANYKDHIDMRNKTLEKINMENPVWFAYYSERLNELKKLLSYMEARVSQVRGQLYEGIKKGSNVSLGEREIQKYIDADELYIEIHVLMLEVKEVHDLYASAVENFRNVGYAMNNITKIRVAGLEDVTL